MTRHLPLIALIVLLWNSAIATADSLRVTLVQSEEGAPYHEFVTTLMDEVAQKKLSWKILQESRLTQVTDLVVAIGAHACKEVAETRFPVLCVLVSKSGYDKIRAEQSSPNVKFSAIYLDQPIPRRIALIQALLPEKRVLGVMYANPSEDLIQLRSYLAAKKLTLIEKKISPEFPLFSALQDVVQESEVILAFPDPMVYNGTSIRNILLASYRQNIPLIGFAKSYVTAGALAAIFTNPSQVADQTIVAISQFSETSTLPHAQYPTDFEVVINNQVANSLAIHAKDVLLLTKQIKAADIEGRGK